jgi:hypothetical protein
MAFEDLPQVIDYVLDKTEYSKLNYIGHSMGTIMIYALLSEKVEYNDKVHLAISLAPAVFLNNGSLRFHRNLPLGLFESLTEGVIRYPRGFTSTICIISDTLCWVLLGDCFVRDQAHLSYAEYLTFLGELPNTLSISNSRRMNDMWDATDFKFRNTLESPPKVMDMKKVTTDQAFFGGHVDEVSPRDSAIELIK